MGKTIREWEARSEAGMKNRVGNTVWETQCGNQDVGNTVWETQCGKQDVGNRMLVESVA